MVTQKPVAWICRTCGKFDTADDPDALAKPEHVPYRGTDIGTCKGKMVPLYEAFPIVTEEKGVTKLEQLTAAIVPSFIESMLKDHRGDLRTYPEWREGVVMDAVRIAELIIEACKGR